MNKKNRIERLTECLSRFKQIRLDIDKSDPESRTKLKLEAEIISNEVSAIRLLQGYGRLSNNILISSISLIGGGSISAIIIKLL